MTLVVGSNTGGGSTVVGPNTGGEYTVSTVV